MLTPPFAAQSPQSSTSLSIRPLQNGPVRSLLLFPLIAAAALAAEPAQTIPVWPDGVQGPVPDKGPERVLPAQPNTKQVLRVEGVTEATLLYYPAPKDKATGAAIVIAPGGGFSKLALDLEGTEVAEFFNQYGIAGFVLKYRTAPAKSPDPQLGAVLDAQRAVSLVRSRAAEFGVQKDRVGLLGISAGGQVAVIAASSDTRLYEPKGEVDVPSYRPDFLALVYPWKIQDADDPKSLRKDIRIDDTMPPTFIAHAVDDAGAKIEGSLLLFQALHNEKVPVELHAYVKGGHGFGLRPAEAPTPTDWPQRFAEWLAVMGLARK
jgi:acetyl esterase/lipase